MSGPVRIVDERGVYPSALDAVVEGQRRYYARVPRIIRTHLKPEDWRR